MTTRLKEYLEIKNNPSLAILKHFKEMDSLADKMTRRTVEETLKAIIKDFERQLEELVKQLENAIPGISKEMAKQVREKIYDDVSTFKGEKGNEGDKGEKGEQGEKGEKGEIGAKGIDGRDGIDGKTGEPGKDGSPDKPEDIAKKLNTLEEKVKIDVIKDLSKIIEDIKSNIRQRTKGGGGMGNILAEVPVGSINGTNTIFTLSTIPKTNSLILLVNGQFQRINIDFTISGKTITMLWNIPTGSEIFAWFIR